MKFSEFYKLIESAGWTIEKGKNITSMFIPTLTTLSLWADIRPKRYLKVLLTA
jgi:hypothetical protein